MNSRIIPEPERLRSLVGSEGNFLYTEIAAMAGMHARTFRKFMARERLPFVRPSPRRIVIRASDLTHDFVEALIDEAESLRDFRSGQVVYFIQAGATGPIKIGIACDIHRRHFELQNQHYEELRLLATTTGGLRLERELHRRFAEHRIRGEWFAPHPRILAEIERLSA